ncbi:autophagy-related protein 2 homolog A isoform X2 [Anthonomus grandis grandis]|uniref:autophagy-related protein 2 homolog A isoform X2 n=1 Tax=Anthonomus grandis grandis TaxID=2921223 RepID=UPI0021653FA3|nr:autophagy-related protein 2 homolog A isoform X2 [Anthonomus grandis grandis]
MPWYDNLIPESIKKSVCSCLIKRYLSHFIENEITRDQLNLDLFNGRASAERISLAVEALNELADSQNWPLQFVDGYIDKIHIYVPWTSIFSDSTEVEISGLKITVQPKQIKEDATSMFESMWNSMTSSMQLAQEYAKGESAKKESSYQTFEGIEQFAKTIDTVVRKVKVKLSNTELQIEHLPKVNDKGVGLLINIDSMEYYDDYSTEKFCDQDTLDPSNPESQKAYLIDSFATKNLILQGVNISTVEFSSVDKTVSKSLKRQESKDSSKGSEYFFKSTTESHDDDSESESGHINEEILDRHVILCGKCYNNQEVKLKLKQSENINGPKVSIEVNLGSLILFLSPRQFHILAELVEGFSKVDLEDKSKVVHKESPRSKPMTEKDYKIVEQQLREMITQNRNLQGFNLFQGHGWSTGALDESTDSLYVPMPSADNNMHDSTLSGCSSSMESSTTSSMMSFMTENTSQTKRKSTNIELDPTAEISQFQLRVATLAVILLHEDLLTHTMGTEKMLVWQMRNLAQKFFDSVNFSIFSGVISDGFEYVHKALDNACNMSHLRLLASPVKLEGNESTSNSTFSIKGDLTVSKLELTEYLHTGGITNIPILNFQLPQNAKKPSAAKPNLAVKFKHKKRIGKRANVGKKSGPKTDISMHLEKCSLEFDISIIDRIAPLIYHPPICKTDQKDPNALVTNEGQISSVTSVQDLKISCPSFNFKLRFPIPDFRAATDMSKVPWWDRNVRPDYLSLNLQNATFHTMFQTGQTCSEYEVDCKLLDIYYFESENTTGIHVARSGKEEKYTVSGPSSKSHARLSIKFFPKKLDDEDDHDEIPDPMTHSFYGVFENQGNPDPGPFGGKRVVHESDTPHNRESNDVSEAAEQVIPGDKSELNNFIETTTSNTEILVEVALPTVSIQLGSKHIYELIYNRINNDLLLWESQAPKPCTNKTPLMQFSNLALDDKFIVANAGYQYESDSSSSEDEEPLNVFYSAYDIKHSSKYMPMPQRRTSQSEFVMSLNILEGILDLNPPARDSTDNVIPGQEGELLLKVSNANVFIVSGYKGDTDLGYVCVQVNNAQLFHCDIQPTKPSNSPLKDIGAIIGKDLFPTIYQSEQKSILNSGNRSGFREMFTVALKIQANHETHHVKVVTVSLGLNKATLRHKMGQQPNTWISHIIDFFNVQDYPIAGYVAKDVLTELHVHLWDCAVDYRPLHVPIRSVITIGAFSLSSHLTAAANTSTLTLMFEDCGLFLSDKAPPKNGVASTVKVDLQRDYINVLELGLFEISIRTTDKQSGINPHIDLRTSINMLHIRTCSDSGRALFQLLTYYISNGDLNLKKNSEEEPDLKSRVTEPEPITLNPSENSLSKSKEEQISELLADAMKESPKQNSNVASMQPGAKLFYFPDEKEAVEELPPHNTHVMADLGECLPKHFSKSPSSPNTDEEFCVVGEEALRLNEGVPVVTWHNDTIEFVEDHFSSPERGRRDPLAPPKDFPTPTSRYTLCDMSIVWHMYGGHDFKRRDDPKKGVKFSEKQLSDTVSFSKNKVTLSQVDDARTKDLTWMQKGGPGRDHAVLMELQLSKVKFSHEVYPDTAKEASRQVLSICDVEIRDRLATSQINKFLYQYSRQSIPREPNSNMILIKALHVRPDPKIKREECDLKISILPIRLNIDQDALFFMINFFKELGSDGHDNLATGKETNPTHQPPIMTVSIDNEDEITQQAIETVNENLILLESRYHAEPEELAESDANSGATGDDDAPIYFRYVEFTQDVLIRLDYEGKRVDMSHGPLAGILMGLGHLKCSEIRLKRLVHRHGLLGVSKLIGYLLQEWISDIKRNQLSNILGGVGPMKAVVQLFQGIKDLFWLPIQQYQKDGRIVRGLQRGANSFTTSTAVAALELTTRLIYFIQITAETAYDMLSPSGPSIRTKRLAKRKIRRKRYHQPQDIREGLNNACIVVKEGIGETADNIIQTAAMEKEQKGISGAVGAVIRQIPPTILKPILIASEATTNVLGGMQSQLVPDARKEANEKWRSDLL